MWPFRPPGASLHFFRARLGLIHFSAFFWRFKSAAHRAGTEFFLPTNLHAVSHQLASSRLWFAPTLLWLSNSNHTLMTICWLGMMASLLLVSNVWPRANLLVCFVCFLSFVAAALGIPRDISPTACSWRRVSSRCSSRQPAFCGLGQSNPPSRVSLFLLQWEWFRIYFESGVVSRQR